jgi:predicted RNA-binding protein with PIN domain
MSDIQRMSGNFNPPELIGEMSILTGNAPVATMRGYITEVTSYTRGRGRLFCEVKGYQPCHNADEVIQAIGYDSERDMDNPTCSVFCAHGAGFLVEWDKVEEYMHVDSGWQEPEQEGTKVEPEDDVRNSPRVENARISKNPVDHIKNTPANEPTKLQPGSRLSNSLQEDKELEEIFIRTYGQIKQKLSHSSGSLGYEKKIIVENTPRKQLSLNIRREPVKEYLLVDGYNIIFSWEELNALARENIDAARGKLMDILCNYQGFKNCILILVFDAYKVKGGIGEVLQYHNIHVVFTKEAETADQYIEKVTHELAGENRVTVATSDALEQVIIMGKGAARLSANDLKEEIIRIRDEIRREYLDRQSSGRAYLKEKLSDDIFEFLQESSSGVVE